MTDEDTLDISITAVASPPRSFILPWAQAFRAHPPKTKEIAELKKVFQQQGYETYASVTVDGRLIGTETSGGGHAEEHILKAGTWDIALAQARTAAQTRGSSELALLINRSPCSACTKKLVEALNKVKSSSPGVRFILAPTGTYEPSIAAPQEEIESYANLLAQTLKIPLEKAMAGTQKTDYLREDPDKGGVTTMADILSLQGAGWQLQQLLVRRVSARGNQWRMAIERAAKHALAQKVGADNSKIS